MEGAGQGAVSDHRRASAMNSEMALSAMAGSARSLVPDALGAIVGTMEGMLETETPGGVAGDGVSVSVEPVGVAPCCTFGMVLSMRSPSFTEMILSRSLLGIMSKSVTAMTRGPLEALVDGTGTVTRSELSLEESSVTTSARAFRKLEVDGRAVQDAMCDLCLLTPSTIAIQ